MSETAQLRYQLHPQAAHRTVAGEVFVVTGDRAFHRLQAASSIALFDALSRSPAGACADELTDLLLREFAVTEAQARADVATFLATLVQRQLAVAVASDLSAPSPSRVAAPDFTAKVTK
jgi:hypothetical protein